MAGVVEEQKNGNLNVDLNLVPFIDLLSMLVLFLLITAVWLQVAALPASLDSNKAGALTQLKQSQKLNIHLTNHGYALSWPDGMKTKNLPKYLAKNNQGYNKDILLKLLKKNPAPLPSASVSAEDLVDYGYVVEAIDVLKESGIPLVALTAD
jgi:biopolymer transport protein ExbD